MEAEDLLDDFEHYTNIMKERQERVERKNPKKNWNDKKNKNETWRKGHWNENIDWKWNDLLWRRNEWRLSLKKELLSNAFNLNKKNLGSEEKIVAIKERDKLTVKLSKFDLKKFDGTILQWKVLGCLWSYHHDIDKFSYWQGQIQEAAVEILFGVELTKDNYEIAVDMLKERYGKNHVMIDAHYAKIIKLLVAT